MPPNDSDTNRSVPSRTSDADRLRGVRLLLVEDNDDIREVVREMLLGCGAEVFSAASVEEALSLVNSVEFDLLVSDIGMPIRDGYDLIRELRTLSPAPKASVPAIALSAFVQPTDHQRSLEAGFSAHIDKPFSPEQLIATAARLMGLRRAGSHESMMVDGQAST